MFSDQTRTRRPSDTLDRVERAAHHSDHERPQIEGRLKLDFHTGGQGRVHNGLPVPLDSLPGLRDHFIEFRLEDRLRLAMAVATIPSPPFVPA